VFQTERVKELSEAKQRDRAIKGYASAFNIVEIRVPIDDEEIEGAVAYLERKGKPGYA
jgi:hypothetical protein